jgi:hypothetical protein
MGAGKLGRGYRYTPEDRELLRHIAARQFDVLERRGKVGHPLAWENARAEILADLQTLLDKDEIWRLDEDVVPGYVERSFGRAAASSWPPAEVQLADRVLRFGGQIDRVDLGPPTESPRRAVLIDYKTGGADRYEGMRDDPLQAGRAVQLALYARALRAALGEPLQVTAEYRFISSKGHFKRLAMPMTTEVDRRLEQVVQVVADGISGGVFLPVPGEADFRGSNANCTFCDFDRVCSTTRADAWQRKHDQPGARLHLELALPTVEA